MDYYLNKKGDGMKRKPGILLPQRGLICIYYLARNMEESVQNMCNFRRKLCVAVNNSVVGCYE